VALKSGIVDQLRIKGETKVSSWFDILFGILKMLNN
jgi:hypothetical protein